MSGQQSWRLRVHLAAVGRVGHCREGSCQTLLGCPDRCAVRAPFQVLPPHHQRSPSGSGRIAWHGLIIPHRRSIHTARSSCGALEPSKMSWRPLECTGTVLQYYVLHGGGQEARGRFQRSSQKWLIAVGSWGPRSGGCKPVGGPVSGGGGGQKRSWQNGLLYVKRRRGWSPLTHFRRMTVAGGGCRWLECIRREEGRGGEGLEPKNLCSKNGPNE